MRRAKNFIKELLLILIFLFILILDIKLVIDYHTKTNIVYIQAPTISTEIKTLNIKIEHKQIAYCELYSSTDIENLAKLIWVEARGENTTAKKAAVVWCVLNRLDSGMWGDTIEEIISEPNQFAKYADCPLEEEFLWLAEDVLERWAAEKRGEIDVGRVLPCDYYFFGGSTGTNRFRKVYDKDAEKWDWSLPSPYDE